MENPTHLAEVISPGRHRGTPADCVEAGVIKINYEIVVQENL